MRMSLDGIFKTYSNDNVNDNVNDNEYDNVNDNASGWPAVAVAVEYYNTVPDLINEHALISGHPIFF